MSRKSFIDYVKIFVKAGDGGNGHVGFRREKFVPKGGPDGGDGGRGGDVIAIGIKDEFSLIEYKYKRHFRAKPGAHGGKRQRTGKSADDLILPVPLGTIIKNAETDQIIGEILEDQQTLTIQEGGKGGLGNQHFATSTNQAPRKATEGETREGFWVQMELKLMANVGLVGFPNAGKSTLLSTLTKAKPKIGHYAFTTLNPSIGVSRLGEEVLIIGDIPGIIEDAHTGVGLGVQFLKHTQRAEKLLFMLNGDPYAPSGPFEQWETLTHELHAFDNTLLDKASMIVLNKTDLLDQEQIAEIQKQFAKKNLPIHLISCHNGDGLEELNKKIHEIA